MINKESVDAKHSRLVFETPGAIDGQRDRELPFVICVLANLSGDRRRSRQSNTEHRFISPKTSDAIIKGIRPSVQIRGPVLADGRETSCELFFESMQDFRPERIVERLLAATDLSLSEAAIELSKHLGRVSVGSGEKSPFPTNDIAHDIITSILSEILHDVKLQSLHATWMGIDSLIKAGAPSQSVTITLLDISKEELLSSRDENSLSGSVTQAFEKLGHRTLGGHPPGAVLVDFDLGPGDSNLLMAIGEAGEALETVFVAPASSKFVPSHMLATFNRIAEQLPFFFQQRHKGWNAFRRQECAQYVYLTAPRILLRPPYRSVKLPIQDSATNSQMDFDERVGTSPHRNLLWGAGIYPLARILIGSFIRYGWTAAISPLDSSGMTLDYSTYVPDGERQGQVGPTALPMHKNSAGILADLGFMVLFECKDTSTIAIFDDCSCHKTTNPGRYLLFHMALFRLRHALLLFARHRRFVDLSDGDVKKALEQWLSRYTAPKSNIAIAISQMQRWPLSSYTVGNPISDQTTRHFQIELALNYGAERVAPVTVEMTTPEHRRQDFSTTDIMLETTIRVGTLIRPKHNNL